MAVVSPPDRPVGRRAAVTPTPVAARARELGLRLLQPARIRDDEAVAAIAALRPELGVLADYGRIVPSAILELPPHGILNVHPSLLPRHRGASPIAATILAGDPTTGVTLIRMDAGLDTGPIVASEGWRARRNGDGTRARGSGASDRGAVSWAGSCQAGWPDGSEARPQDRGAATLTRPLRREDGRLDPDRTSGGARAAGAGATSPGRGASSTPSPVASPSGERARAPWPLTTSPVAWSRPTGSRR